MGGEKKEEKRGIGNEDERGNREEGKIVQLTCKHPLKPPTRHQQKGNTQHLSQ